jgi:hypothetical protein
MKPLFLLILVLLSSFASATHTDCLSLSKVEASASKKAPHFFEELKSEDDFLALARTVRTGGGEEKVVKVLYHRKSPGGPKLYFMNMNEFEYHDEFAEAHTGFKGSEAKFNRNYQGTGADREYNQGSLVLSKGTGKDGKDRVLLEIFSGDTMDAKHIKELHNAISEKLKIGAELVFHPLGVDHERVMAGAKEFAVPFVTNDELNKGRTYLPLNEGAAYGYVKIIDPKDTDPLLGINDIAVFENVPNDIGLVGGVVTGEFQTPLSHVNVKSINRGTVNMALKGAKEQFKKYEGKPIELIAEGNTYKIRELPEHEAQKLIAEFWKDKKPRAGERPQSNVPEKYQGKLLDLTSYYEKLPTFKDHQQLIRTVGAKAANLALIHYILQNFKSPNVTSPPPFSAHFGFFDDFMKQRQKTSTGKLSTPDKLIREILNKNNLLDPTLSHPIEKVRPALEEIRNTILKSKVPDKLIAELKRAILEDPTSAIYHKNQPILLLRSSTNSEDMIGFSGAGLYNSTSVKLYEPDAKGNLKLRAWKDIEKDLREKIPYVYSSVWNERAFLEREWYSVSGERHLDVKAAIAIHGGFNGTVEEGKIGETANGVAITTNINNPADKSKIYINGQHYGLSVTNPPSKEELKKYGMNENDPYLTEELLVTNFVASIEDRRRPDSWQRWPYERRQSSTVKGNTPVFKNDEEVRRLAVVLDHISNSMAKVYGKKATDFIADVEWNIFGEDRTISINQSRPFTPPTQSR